MVDVVDDHELWVESLDELLDVADEVPVVVALLAEDVEADVVERVAGLGMLGEFAADGCADVRAVEGVYPQDAGAVAGRGGRTGLTGLGGVQDLDGEVLGEVVCSAGFPSGEVGDVVLSQVRLAVDGDQWLDCELTEVAGWRELACSPGLVIALVVAVAIIVDLHGVFLG